MDDWQEAECYAKMYYESIIPAVLEKDEESVLAVLKSFQYSRALNRLEESPCHIINCFEVAIATYFLDEEIIKRLWEKSAKTQAPVSTIISFIDLENEHEDIFIPDKYSNKLQRTGRRLIYKGMMMEREGRNSRIIKI